MVKPQPVTKSGRQLVTRDWRDDSGFVVDFHAQDCIRNSHSDWEELGEPDPGCDCDVYPAVLTIESEAMKLARASSAPSWPEPTPEAIEALATALEIELHGVSLPPPLPKSVDMARAILTALRDSSPMTDSIDRQPSTEAHEHHPAVYCVVCDERRAAIRASQAPETALLREAAQEWADLCHDYDLNERGQAVMARLRAALASAPAPDAGTDLRARVKAEELRLATHPECQWHEYGEPDEDGIRTTGKCVPIIQVIRSLNGLLAAHPIAPSAPAEGRDETD